MTFEALKGLPLGDARNSYADVYMLHFGNMVPYKHPKMTHLRHGEYTLAVLLSPFFWTRPGGEVIALREESKTEEYERVEGLMKHLHGAVVEKIQRMDGVLSLRLSTGDVFDLADANDEELFGWEIVGPEGFYVHE